MSVTEYFGWLLPGDPQDIAWDMQGVPGPKIPMMYNFCETCGLLVHPANNAYLITDIIEGGTQYQEGFAQHFLPVHAHGRYLCFGIPEYSQFLEGSIMRMVLDPKADIAEAQRQMRRGLDEAIRLAGDGQNGGCFSMERRKGVWAQVYRCKWVQRMEKGDK